MSAPGESIADLKSRLRIDEAWWLLNLPGKPGRCCKSPFRPEEKHPSFSIYGDGMKAKDHATGETFDVVDFVARALDMDTAGAVRWLREKAGGGSSRAYASTVESQKRAKPWPQMQLGTAEEMATLAKLRGLTTRAVKLADDRGFLFFGKQWGLPFWCITDSARRCVELRRLDGKPWPAFGQVPERKAHCCGDKAWPIGLAECAEFERVLLVEGVGDFLAAHAVIDGEGRNSDVAALCCLGAAVRLPEAAARQLGAKRVRIIPQMDDPGQRAAKSWARTLADAGAVVDGFSLAGIEDEGGQPIKDLGDVFAKASRESLNHKPEILEVCP